MTFLTQDPVTSALETLRATRQNLATQLEATDRAIEALEAVSGRPTALPKAAAPTRRRVLREKPAEGTHLKAGKSGQESAAARDRAVLSIVARGVSAKSLIVSELPIFPGTTAIQHSRAVSNSLNRLRVTGLVRRGDNGWEVTAKGRRTLGAEDAAKEEP